jgi:hypothetical protein
MSALVIQGIRLRRCLLAAVFASAGILAGAIVFGQTTTPSPAATAVLSTAPLAPPIVPASTAPVPLPNTSPLPFEGAPPISYGWVTANNGHLWCNGQRCTFIGFNFTTYPVISADGWNSKGFYQYPAGRAVIVQHLNYIKNVLHCNLIRFNDMDVGSGTNWFCVGNGPLTGTMTLDPTYMEEFDWLVSQCKALDIRILLTLYQRRQVVSADAPQWTCDCFNEMLASPYAPPNPSVLGSIWPWCALDDGALRYNLDFAYKLLTHVGQYTGIPLGQDPVLLGVTPMNERSFCRDGYLFGQPANYPTNQVSTVPVYWAATLSVANTFMTTNGVSIRVTTPPNPLISMNKVVTQEFCGWVDTQYSLKYANFLRTLTPALITGNPYYGNGPWSCLVGPAAASDAPDCHFYSRNVKTDPNGFLTIPAGAQRTPFGAVLAGCTYGGKVRACTEIGIVAQDGSNQVDPVSEQQQELQAIVSTLIANDEDIAVLYAYGWKPLGLPASNGVASTDVVGYYDLRALTSFLNSGAPDQFIRFHDLTQRPTAAPTIVSPTNGLYGSGVGNAFTQYGPYTDPALLAVPASQNVLVELPATTAAKAVSLRDPMGKVRRSEVQRSLAP